MTFDVGYVLYFWDETIGYPGAFHGRSLLLGEVTLYAGMLLSCVLLVCNAIMTYAMRSNATSLAFGILASFFLFIGLTVVYLFFWQILRDGWNLLNDPERIAAGVGGGAMLVSSNVIGYSLTGLLAARLFITRPKKGVQVALWALVFIHAALFVVWIMHPVPPAIAGAALSFAYAASIGGSAYASRSISKEHDA